MPQLFYLRFDIFILSDRILRLRFDNLFYRTVFCVCGSIFLFYRPVFHFCIVSMSKQDFLNIGFMSLIFLY